MERKMSDKPVLTKELGIKDLGEAVEGGMLIALIMLEVSHDGFQFSDFSEFWRKIQQPENKIKLEMAWQDIAKAKPQAIDLDMEKAFQIVMQRVLPYIPKMIKIFK